MIDALARFLSKRRPQIQFTGQIRTYGLFSMGDSRFYGFFVSRNHDLPVDWEKVRRLGLKVMMNYQHDASLDPVKPRHPFEECDVAVSAGNENQ